MPTTHLHAIVQICVRTLVKVYSGLDICIQTIFRIDQIHCSLAPYKHNRTVARAEFACQLKTKREIEKHLAA